MREFEKYWKELNEKYGLDLKLDIDLEDHAEEIRTNLVCGMSFDEAVQSTF